MNWQVAEPILRSGCFALVLVLMALAEIVLPRRPLACRRPLRWASNLGMHALNVLIVRALLPLGAVGVAVLADDRKWGLFNNLPIPRWLAVILAFLAFDFLIYLQHVMFHAVPALWRLHMVHHADHDVDFSTGLRFHPLEILLSMGIKCAAVVLLGAPALSVLLFEAALNATALFSHGNLRLQSWLDRAVRLVFVTPDMHRIHHSADAEETNRNFGFNFAWWDYLLGTYRAQPRESHESMSLGLRQFPDERVERLPDMLALPFRGDSGHYAITR
jgi:sterol desaturase/sphingolipid hydroxylase (fatty acid hydroxylase superfamily)